MFGLMWQRDHESMIRNLHAIIDDLRSRLGREEKKDTQWWRMEGRHAHFMMQIGPGYDTRSPLSDIVQQIIRSSLQAGVPVYKTIIDAIKLSGGHGIELYPKIYVECYVRYAKAIWKCHHCSSLVDDSELMHCPQCGAERKIKERQ